MSAKPARATIRGNSALRRNKHLPRKVVPMFARCLFALGTAMLLWFIKRPAVELLCFGHNPALGELLRKATDARGKSISGSAGITFAIYQDQSGGAPLWLESQSVQADATEDYTAQLGATRPEGLPLELFTSGEARWLGVRVNGGEEQPPVLPLSVPYALKAVDAGTLGGFRSRPSCKTPHLSSAQRRPMARL